MKYFIGFLAGVIVTSIFFTMKLRQMTGNVDQPEEVVEEYSADESMPEGFLAFYQRFHEDSLFQLEHIVFPLQGIPAEADSMTIVEGSFRWQKENWVMHHPIEDAGTQFSRSMKKVGDEIVIENITVAKGQYGMQRRFSKMSDEWYLIYYAGMNRLASND